MKMKYQEKLSKKILLLILLVPLFSSIIISIVNIVHMKIRLTEYSRDNIKTMVQIAATSLDTDLLLSIQPGEEDSKEFREIFAVLDGFRTSKDVMYIYTMRKVGDEVQFIVDVDDSDIAAIGEAFPTYDEIEEAFQGKVTLDREVSHDEWGNYYSAFAPVRNHAGDVVAIVGIDCSLENIEHQVHVMTVSMIMIHAVCAVVLGFLTMAVLKLMTSYGYEASHDSLTGVYNRNYASRFIEKNCGESEQYAFLLLDVDNFKQVNDSCGHQAGDWILRMFSQILLNNCRGRDIAIRLGGDEFALYVDQVLDEEQLENLYERMRETFIKKSRLICPEAVETGLSCGCIVCSEKIPFNEMYNQADALLYEAKESGKGNIKTGFYESGMR